MTAVHGAPYPPGHPAPQHVNVEPGLHHVQGHGTEWYAADGTLIRAIARGHVVDVCEALSD